MSDSLRDRIAGALYRQFPPYQLGYTFGCPTVKWDDESERCKEVYRRDADAVIAELGLHKESTDPEQIIGHGYPPMHRYVTDWQTGPTYCNRCGIPHTNKCKRPADV